MPLECRAVPAVIFVHNNHDAGAGSLRAAIGSAAPGDTIKFDTTLFGQTIHLTTGELDVAHNLTIAGLGVGLLTVSGNDASRVFHVGTGATATVNGLTISHGMNADGAGGAIDNAGTLALIDSAVINSAATGGTTADMPYGGGGILNESGAELTLTRTVVANDTATAGAGLDVFGGGLLNLGSATIAGSSFTGDKATGGAGDDFFVASVGGAIANFGGASLTVTGSTFLGNEAVGAATATFGRPFTLGIGGAIENDAGFGLDAPSTATISTSMFIGNVATAGTGGAGNGGAIDNEGPGSTLAPSNSIVTGNSSLGGPGIAGYLAEGIGGGVMNYLYSTLTVQSSVISGNKAIGGNGVPNSATQTGYAGGAAGGGIDSLVATATISGSTISGNIARAPAPARTPARPALMPAAAASTPPAC